METINPEQYGVGYLGASNAASIAGVGRHSRIEIYYSVLGHKQAQPSAPINYAEMGHKFEGDIIRLFELQKNKVVVDRQAEYTHPCRDLDGFHFIRAHIDGAIRDATGVCPVEAKLVNKYAKKEWMETLPIDYYYQVLAQMMLSCAKVGYIAAAFVDWQALAESENLGYALDDFVIFEVMEDKGIMEEILSTQIYFWENYIYKKIPPPIQPERADYLQQVRLLKKMKGEVMGVLSLNDNNAKRAEMVAKYREYEAIKNEVKLINGMLLSLKKQERQALAYIEEQMGNFKETDVIPELGGKIIFQQKNRRGFTVAPNVYYKIGFTEVK
jgi:predicted phage-related endonuclease